MTVVGVKTEQRRWREDDCPRLPRQSPTTDPPYPFGMTLSAVAPAVVEPVLVPASGSVVEPNAIAPAPGRA